VQVGHQDLARSARFGGCIGEVVPTATTCCGDGLDTTASGKNDAAEGCQVLDAELRLDAPIEATPGTQHSYDIVLARGGVPLGSNVYAAVGQLTGTPPSQTRCSSASRATEQVPGARSSTSLGDRGNKVNRRSRCPRRHRCIIVALPDRHQRRARLTSGLSADAGARSARRAPAQLSGDSFHSRRRVSSTSAWRGEEANTTTLNRDV